tara:strand:- start:232 stop:1026 length:795 start_codon:yes stop_codon:yes gene_type:complete
MFRKLPDGRTISSILLPVMRTLAWPIAVILLPLLYGQGKWVRKKSPRLPHAPTPWSGKISGPRAISVLGLGDSTVAGVGVNDADRGLVAQFCNHLAALTGRGVKWDALGESGATSKDILADFLPKALSHKADLILVSLGANDAKDLKPLWSTVSRFRQLLTSLHRANPDSLIIFSSLPAFRYFHLLPQPTRFLINSHAEAIDSSIRKMVETHSFAMMTPRPPKYPEGFFATDNFHPSEQGYEGWAKFAIEDALARGALGQFSSG